MKGPLLSIIVPVYNVEKYIRPCIESIFNQELLENDFEVILVDDGCTDGTMGIVYEIMKSHSNIHLIQQANQGPSAARNNGLKKARGRYVLFVDSDDLLIAKSLPPLLSFAIERDLDILKSNAIIIDDKDIQTDNIPQKNHWEKWNNEVTNGVIGFISQFDPRKPWLIVNLIKKEFLINNNLYLADGISVGEDLLMSVRMYLKAQRFMAIPYTHYIYRRNDTSIMSTIHVNRLLDLNKVLEILYKLKIETPLFMDGRRKMDETIYTHFSINMWYLSHYTSLYPHRMEVINDLRRRLPKLSFHDNMKQRITTFFYKYMPSTYITFRYLTAKRKYNQ